MKMSGPYMLGPVLPLPAVQHLWASSHGTVVLLGAPGHGLVLTTPDISILELSPPAWPLWELGSASGPPSFV